VSFPSLEALAIEVAECRKCRLADTRKSVVFGEGNPEANLMVIGEAPGADEDASGRPFVGRSGQLLTKILQAVEFSREEVFIANIVKCRPPENRNPLQDEITCCTPWLEKQLEIISPKVILLLGKVAANTIFSNQTALKGNEGQSAGVERSRLFRNIPSCGTAPQPELETSLLGGCAADATPL